MSVTKKSTVDIRNWDDTKYGDKNFRQGHPHMPNTTMRCCMVACSGHGKTNTACDLIMRYLSWDRLFVFSPNFEQPKYLMLKDLCDKMEIDREKRAVKYVNNYNHKHPPHRHISLEDLELEPIAEFSPTLEGFNLKDLNKKNQYMIVLDDIVLQKNQTQFIELFSMGRHKNCQTMYLSQDWFSIPKLCRRNTNLFLLFGHLPEMNIDMIRRDAGVPLDKNEWRDAYKRGTTEPFSFITIDKTKSKMNEQFTICFNKPLINFDRQLLSSSESDSE